MGSSRKIFYCTLFVIFNLFHENRNRFLDSTSHNGIIDIIERKSYTLKYTYYAISDDVFRFPFSTEVGKKSNDSIKLRGSCTYILQLEIIQYSS